MAVRPIGKNALGHALPVAWRLVLEMVFAKSQNAHIHPPLARLADATSLVVLKHAQELDL